MYNPGNLDRLNNYFLKFIGGDRYFTQKKYSQMICFLEGDHFFRSVRLDVFDRKSSTPILNNKIVILRVSHYSRIHRHFAKLYQ